MNLKLDIHSVRGGFSLVLEEDFSLAEVTAIVGPSGSGKTSLLRAICGLESCDGSIVFDEQPWLSSNKKPLACFQRGVAYVNQDAWIFPHLSVDKLLAFAEKRAKHLPQRFYRESLLTTLGIEKLLQHRSHELSGGQRQLVAIAQALLAQPNLLLLDEPVSALDKNNRELVLAQLLKLKNEFQLGMLIVSHYPEELLHLADSLVYLQNGRVVFRDKFIPALTNLQYPLAQNEEAFSILDLQDCQWDEKQRLLHFQIGKQKIRIAGSCLPEQNEHYRFRVLAKDVSLNLEHAEHSSILNILAATVSNIQYLDNGQCLVQVSVEGQQLLARISQFSCESLGLQPGQSVFLQIKALAIVG